MEFIFSLLKLTVLSVLVSRQCQAQRIPTGAERQEILDAHNRARGEVAAKWNVSSMPALVWSDAAANHGRSHLSSNGCGFAHSNSYAAGFGENLAIGHGSWTVAIYNGWHSSEEACFDAVAPNWGQCSCTCGHYTAVNWQDTTVVGCATCDSNRLYICNYGQSPPNFNNRPVFNAGTGAPCSACPSDKPNCVNDLCSASGNGATTSTTTSTTTQGPNPTTTTNQPSPTSAGSCGQPINGAHQDALSPLASNPSSSLADCCAQCQAQPGCVSYTFASLQGAMLCGMYDTPVTSGTGFPPGATSGNLESGPPPTNPPTNPPANPCNPNPCQNSGTCNANGNSFTCSCASGWTGNTCTQDFDDCVPNPCRNGGTCTDRGTNDFSCVCPTGFTGVQCQVEVTTTQATQPTTTQGTLATTTTRAATTTTATQPATTTTQATTTSTQATQVVTTTETRMTTTTNTEQTTAPATAPPEGPCATFSLNPCQFGQCVPEPANTLGWVCQCQPGYENSNSNSCNREPHRVFRFIFDRALPSSQVDVFLQEFEATLAEFLSVPASRITDAQVVDTSGPLIVVEVTVSGAVDFDEPGALEFYDSLTLPASTEPSPGLTAMSGFATISRVECVGAGCPAVGPEGAPGDQQASVVQEGGGEAGGMSMGAMIGVAVTIVVIVVLAVAGGYWGYRRYMNSKVEFYEERNSMHAPSMQGGNPNYNAPSGSVQMQQTSGYF